MQQNNKGIMISIDFKSIFFTKIEKKLSYYLIDPHK